MYVAQLYKPPSSKDIPIDFRVELLRNAPNPVGVLKSKGQEMLRILSIDYVVLCDSRGKNIFFGDFFILYDL